MTLPYSSSKAGQSREKEIRDTLRGLGASAVGFMVDDERGLVIAQFRLGGREITIPVSVATYQRAWLKENPHTSRMRLTRAEHEKRAATQAEHATWAVLADWIKAQATMMACGFLDADMAFLPHIMLPDGRSVADAVIRGDGPLSLPAPKRNE